MNKNEAEGKWTQLKGQMKATWGKLTDDDFALYNGKKDQFFGKLQEKYGLAQQEAEKQLKAMESSCDCSCPSHQKNNTQKKGAA